LNRLTTLARLAVDLDDAIRVRESGRRLPCPARWDGRASERIAEVLVGS
jgi:hypothetical protein